MHIGRVLITFALFGALAMTAIGFWRGDMWGIILGLYLVCTTAGGTIVIWRARR